MTGFYFTDGEFLGGGVQEMSVERWQDLTQLKRNVTSTWSVWERAGPPAAGIINWVIRRATGRIRLSIKEAEYE